MPSVKSIPIGLVQEGERAMRICNACRYCEGFCAVFPAMERRLTFSESDLNYLANLCHECNQCYYSCPYAPPHEFALNLPQTLAEIRTATYQKHTWPGFFAGLFRRNGAAVTLSTVASTVLFILVMLFFIQPSVLFSTHTVAQGSFYAVVSHKTMVWTFGAVSLFVLAALVMEFASFWHSISGSAGSFLSLGALVQATEDSFRLRYLKGGGDGCAYPEGLPSHSRRQFHHLTFYGFLLCFASTTAAAIYHYVFGWQAPYALWSVPVILGTLGGLGLLIGPFGLLCLKVVRNPEPTDRKQIGMDVGFLALLFLTSLSGFLLLALRETAAMGVLLAVHLGLVMAFFVMVPYGKFVHAIYRFAALLRDAIEKQRPLP